MKFIPAFSTGFIVLCWLSSVNAQGKPNTPIKQVPYIEVIDCYKCNELVISLPKPKYPAYVASGPHSYNGIVLVAILIGDEGKVETAKGIAGHQYFYSMLEKESLKARFKSPIVEGKATKLKSIIFYKVVSRATEKKWATKIGIVNGAATYLPKPVYPNVPIDACASGKVSVNVRIGKNGRVKKAEAISGNLFLRNAAVAAAKRARFRWIVDAPPVERSGIVLYNFPQSKGCRTERD
jgi:hypothetical protein